MKPLGGYLRARQRLVQPQPTSSAAPVAKSPSWRPTKRLASSGRFSLVRAAAENDLGPGYYVLKTVPAERMPKEVDRALLQREAMVAAEVSHPNLIAVLSSDLRSQRPLLVLPYLEGISLRRLLAASQRLSAAFALSIVRQIAAAIAALHSAGWLHGQVRSEHIIVSPQGQATLLDLTLARRLDSSECDSSGSNSASLTYVAPEWFSPRSRLSAATDVYSLGILLFEALAGQPPFEAANSPGLITCHRQQAPPDLRRLRSNLTSETSELVQRMLAKEPLRRPSSEQLVRWLAEVEIAELSGVGIHACQNSRLWQTRMSAPLS
jgi:eukaryotic-like serine/threonine-protein kinase